MSFMDGYRAKPVVSGLSLDWRPFGPNATSDKRSHDNEPILQNLSISISAVQSILLARDGSFHINIILRCKQIWPRKCIVYYTHESIK